MGLVICFPTRRTGGKVSLRSAWTLWSAEVVIAEAAWPMVSAAVSARWSRPNPPAWMERVAIDPAGWVLASLLCAQTPPCAAQHTRAEGHGPARGWSAWLPPAQQRLRGHLIPVRMHPSGLPPEEERPAFRLVTAHFVDLEGLEPPASSCSGRRRAWGMAPTPLDGTWPGGRLLRGQPSQATAMSSASQI